jgi:hypothetical protein
VHVAVGQGSGAPNNSLRGLRVTGLTNAVIDVQGQSGAGSMSYVPPTVTRGVSFWLRPITAGQRAQASLVVTDDCGDWPTFVGTGQ